jgi:hypothetical protein
MVSRRRLIYYTILLTSFFWVFGTITFLFLQSLEVNIEVKRRSQVEYFALNKPNWNIKVDRLDLTPPPAIPAPKEILQKKKSVKELKPPPKLPKKIIYALAEYDNHPPGVKLDGPGDEGEGVTVSSKLKKKEDEGYEMHSFNLVASDMMSLHRRLPDYRSDV